MKRVFWIFVYAVIFLVVVGGGGYGVYKYFSTPHTNVLQKKTEIELSNEYLDTLVVDIQKNLESIKMEVSGLSRNLHVMATTLAIFGVIMVVNLILLILLCLLFLSSRKALRKQMENSRISGAE